MIARVPILASDEDILRISAENPGWRTERAPNGQVTMTPPTGGISSKRNARLTRLVDEWAEKHGYIAFDSNGGFRLADSSIVAPDVALIPEAAWLTLGADEREGFLPLAPAVAIELCSKTDDPAVLRLKLERLREAGTSYVVLIDPYRKTIWTAGESPAAFDLDFSQVLN